MKAQFELGITRELLMAKYDCDKIAASCNAALGRMQKDAESHKLGSMKELKKSNVLTISESTTTEYVGEARDVASKFVLFSQQVNKFHKAWNVLPESVPSQFADWLAKHEKNAKPVEEAVPA